MYSILKMVIFHCYVSLPEGKHNEHKGIDGGSKIPFIQALFLGLVSHGK